jgi:predicted phosphoadenosine phosphosulfate sulfurtransferase
MEFLLSTLPSETAENYKKKLEKSMEFWRTKGGCLSDDLVAKLDAAGVKYERGQPTNYKTEKLPLRMEYIDDIDIPEFKEIPTYKRMCVCILKNDHLCKFMGFSLSKTEVERRASAERKYANLVEQRK